MSEAWQKARDFIDSMDKQDVPLVNEKLKLQGFHQGKFTIDWYDGSMDTLGSKNLDYRFVLNEVTRKEVESFATERGLKAKIHSVAAYLLREDKYVAFLGESHFSATEGKLFEEIGKKFYKM